MLFQGVEDIDQPGGKARAPEHLVEGDRHARDVGRHQPPARGGEVAFLLHLGGEAQGGVFRVEHVVDGQGLEAVLLQVDQVDVLL